jgi:Zn finger protein HypA/HybF involved in hydrogenase expression
MIIKSDYLKNTHAILRCGINVPDGKVHGSVFKMAHVNFYERNSKEEFLKKAEELYDSCEEAILAETFYYSDLRKTSNLIQITCKCGQYQNWLSEGKQTKPCPNCGREYMDIYDRKNLSIKICELKPRLNRIGSLPIIESDWRATDD